MLSRVVDQPQSDLGLKVIRRAQQDVSGAVVARKSSLLDAIRLCAELAPVDDKVICRELELDAAQWSRIKSGQAHFPADKYNDLMDICGNEAPLRWLAQKRGYGLVRLKSEVEIENENLRAQLAQREKELDVITRFMRDTRA